MWQIYGLTISTDPDFSILFLDNENLSITM